MKTHFLLFAAMATILCACSSSEKSFVQNPVVGTLPGIELQYAEAMDQYEAELRESNEYTEEAYRKKQQIRDEYAKKLEAEEQRLVGNRITCTTTNSYDADGNVLFDYFVKDTTAVFTRTDYTGDVKWSSYAYHCELVAQRDFYQSSSRLFYALFADDNFTVYGSLLQIHSLTSRQIKKGDIVPCSFSIRNIETENVDELLKNCTRVLLLFKD